MKLKPPARLAVTALVLALALFGWVKADAPAVGWAYDGAQLLKPANRLSIQHTEIICEEFRQQVPAGSNAFTTQEFLSPWRVVILKCATQYGVYLVKDRAKADYLVEVAPDPTARAGFRLVTLAG